MIYTKGYDVHARGVVLTYYNLTNFIDQLKGGPAPFGATPLPKAYILRQRQVQNQACGTLQLLMLHNSNITRRNIGD